MSADTPWPCPVPPELGPGRNPGAMVVLLWCPEDGQLASADLTLGGVNGSGATSAGEGHWVIAETRVAEGRPAPWIVFYDGDTGVLVAQLRHDYVPAVLGAPPKPRGWMGLPEALSSDDGERWWFEGHVDQLHAVVAVFVDESLNGNSLGEGVSFLAGRNRADEFWFEQYFARPHPTDDERMVRCDQADPGAEPWTEVRR